MTRTDSTSPFSAKVITPEIYHLLKRGKKAVRCYNCGKILKIGDGYFVTSQHKLYCSECWEKIHFDLPEVSELIWVYDENRDTWILLTKGEKEEDAHEAKGKDS